MAEAEESGSEYSYVYETDSEYSYYSEEEQDEGEGAEAQTKLADTAEQEADAVTTNQDNNNTNSEEEEDENAALQRHKQQLERFKPKIPDYIKTAEPCAFSEDPGRWIGWMESEVSQERERRLEDCLLYTSPSPRDS